MFGYALLAPHFYGFLGLHGSAIKVNVKGLAHLSQQTGAWHQTLPTMNANGRAHANLLGTDSTHRKGAFL